MFVSRGSGRLLVDVRGQVEAAASTVLIVREKFAFCVALEPPMEPRVSRWLPNRRLTPNLTE